MPVVAVLPVEAIQNRIEAGAFERDSEIKCDAAFGGDLLQPRRPSDSIVARLGNNDGPAIALVNTGQQFVQRHPTGIIRARVPVQLPPAWNLPLIGRVEVHPDDVEELRSLVAN